MWIRQFSVVGSSCDPKDERGEMAAIGAILSAFATEAEPPTPTSQDRDMCGVRERRTEINVGSRYVRASWIWTGKIPEHGIDCDCWMAPR